MRVLIIEDNALNAFCLSRLFESVIASASVTMVSNSDDALCFMDTHLFDLVIIDGELNLVSEFSTHGPQLASLLLQKYPHIPLISWSDSEVMRAAFAQVFVQNNRLLNEYNTWNKSVSPECIRTTWAYYFGELIEDTLPTPAYMIRETTAVYRI